MNKGFTLVELMIVIGIMGIITAIGVPQYLGYIDSSRVTTVQNNLRTIYMQQQEYYRDNNAYYQSGVACADSTTAINANLFSGKTILVNDNFYYCVTQDTVDDFTAQAQEIGGEGRSYTINNLNVTNF